MKKTVCFILITLVFLAVVPFSAAALTGDEYNTSYYEQLSPSAKEFYRAVLDSKDKMLDGTAEIEIHLTEVYASEMQEVINTAASAMRMDEIYTYYFDWSKISIGYSYSESTEKVESIKLFPRDDCENYWFCDYESKSEIESELASVRQAVKDIADEAKKLADDYQRIKFVHDFIISTCAYNTAQSTPRIAWTPASALLYTDSDNGPVCEGYAKAFKLCMDALDIPCALVMGTGVTNNGSEGHMWNAVKLDGKWYGIDLTWDDSKNGTIKTTYFLVGSNTENTSGRSFAESHVTDTQGYMKYPFNAPVLSDTAYVYIADESTDTEGETTNAPVTDETTEAYTPETETIVTEESPHTTESAETDIHTEDAATENTDVSKDTEYTSPDTADSTDHTASETADSTDHTAFDTAEKTEQSTAERWDAVTVTDSGATIIPEGSETEQGHTGKGTDPVQIILICVIALCALLIIMLVIMLKKKR